MDQLRQYVISIICAAIFCGILLSVVSKGTAQNVLKLACGIFITITVIRPINQLPSFSGFDSAVFSFSEAEEMSMRGENLSRESLAAYIIDSTQSYILDKAAAMNAELQVRVTVSDDAIPIPVSVDVEANVTPAVRKRLQEMIEEDLGIAREDQKWTG